ncbi:MAG: hypothetical protein WCL51_14695 [Bacteroidota bacterium]
MKNNQTILFDISAKKLSKKQERKLCKRSPNVTIARMRRRNRRYYLHYRCKRIGLVLNKKNTTLSGTEESLSKLWAIELRDRFGYNLQIIIA